MRPPKPFPWEEVIGFGLGVLRLGPVAFWSMTPREIARAAETVYGKAGQGAMEREALDELLERFPDLPWI